MVMVRPTSLDMISSEPSPDIACTGLPMALAQSFAQRSPQRLSVASAPSTTESISASSFVRAVMRPSCSPARKTSCPLPAPFSMPRSTCPGVQRATPIFDITRPTARSAPANRILRVIAGPPCEGAECTGGGPCTATRGRLESLPKEIPAMATMYRYQLPVEQTGWTLAGQTQTAFTWEYEDEREKLLTLYDKGKKQQWDAAVRIDWSQELDPENPQEIDDRLIPIFGSPIWDKLTNKERIHLRHHQQAQTLSQFMHGEQGALMAAARIVQMAPDLDAKFYAATQVMDEARHVEAYARLLNEKLGIAYPITPGLQALLETVLTDRRWDMTYLGMQILIEGLALAAFQRIRD